MKILSNNQYLEKFPEINKIINNPSIVNRDKIKGYTLSHIHMRMQHFDVKFSNAKIKENEENLIAVFKEKNWIA